MRRLLTIPISHYCEKARWALDRAGIAYTEVRHLQIFHYLPVALAGGGVSVPVLTGAGPRALADSTHILQWVDAQAPGSLYPKDPAQRAEVLRLEDYFDEALGPATRRVVYFHVLDRPDLLRYNCAGVPAFEAAVIEVALPVAALFLRRRLHISAARNTLDLVRIRALFDEVARLGEGRRYLVGEAFSAADLTFACMAAAVLLPAEYGSPLPRLDEVPAGLRALAEELRAHPSGARALRLFREDRRRSP
ncbi:MAG: glutathione S-transferase family protein [Minicystis sp.]